MYAEQGSQLAARGWPGVGPRRYALILEVLGTDGAPPYRVRWSDTDLEAVIHPTADCYVLPAARPVEHA